MKALPTSTTTNNMPKVNLFILILVTVIFVLGAVRLLIFMNPIAIDDAFIYYTYAQNIVEGRLFAYDIRNIPSEGFTSLLYLLLLTPFEFFKVNMSFASMLINLTAVLTTVASISYLTLITGLFKRNTMLIFACVLWLFIVNDINIIQNLNLGLETMLGPMIVVFAGVAIWGTSSPNITYQKRSLNAFFIIIFLSYIIRPESMFFIAITGIPLLLVNKSLPRSQVLKKIFFFALFFIAYHLVKLAFFGDIFPTGFYRKIGPDSGVGYVGDWAKEYGLYILPPLIMVLVTLLFLVIRKPGILFDKPWLWFFCGIIISTMAFFTRTQPIIGYNHRFLTTASFLSYISFLILMMMVMRYLINRLIRIAPITQLSHQFHLIILTGLVIISFFAVSPYIYRSASLFNQFNIYEKALLATENQPYLKFGNHLNAYLDSPETATLVFGDAGAIPYAFEGRFIDFNGLVEPYIAHLFLKPDGQEKTQLFTDYILAQNPDIIFLGWGGLTDGKWEPPINPNSPFQGNIPVALFQSFYDYGIRYICSIDSNYYDIHIGIWIHSPQYDSIVEALFSYCQLDGYILPDGIIIAGEDIEVKFEGISPVDNTPKNDA